MDTMTVICITAAALAVVGIVWMSGYDIGRDSGYVAGTKAERDLANRRVNAVLAEENARRPKAAKNRRKAARKGLPKGSSGGAL